MMSYNIWIDNKQLWQTTLKLYEHNVWVPRCKKWLCYQGIDVASVYLKPEVEEDEEAEVTSLGDESRSKKYLKRRRPKLKVGIDLQTYICLT